MFSTTVSVLLALTGVAVVFHRVGMWAALRYRARARPALDADQALPPLSLLKPVKGVEDELEANLRSFYDQDYPAPLQIVFTSTEPDDPGIAIARRVSAGYPRVETSFVLARDDFGLNPKVSNMHGGLAHARHDLVLQSDANVRLPPDYLRELVEERLATDAALIGSVVVGSGERSPFATLDNLQLTAFTAPGLCMAEELAGITCVLGKAMLFSKRELDTLGGLGVVKDVLAEDFVLCELYKAAGKRVVLSSLAVSNVNVHSSLHRFASRHARWLKMRAVVSLPGFLGDLGSNPVPIALGAWLASGFDPRVTAVLLGVYLYKCAWDARLLHAFRGHGLGWAQLWATPARDLALSAIWLYAAFSRSTVWRGTPLLLGSGSVLIRNDGPLSLRLLRRLRLLRGW
jgi:ceramide glucosyltransferase